MNQTSMRAMLHTVTAAAFVAVAGCAGAPVHPAGHTDVSAGRLVIIGGGLSRDNAAVYRAILDGRSGDGPVCVIPTASADPAGAIESATTTLDLHGGDGTATGILISVDDPASAHDPAVVAAIGRCSGFYFSGGVQSRILTVFRPDGSTTPAYEALRARFDAGAVVAGSSAGAAIMSDPMIAGGSSAGAVANGIGDGGVVITPGLGFVTGMLMDQHFLARGRIGRLLVAVREVDGVDLGFGIDENTALVIDGATAWPVGASGVVVVDDSRDVGLADAMRLDLLSSGDSYDIATGVTTVDPSKTPLAAPDSSHTAPEDAFARWQFLHLLQTFGGSSLLEVSVPAEGASVVLTRTPGTSAYQLPGTGVQGTAAGLTVTGLLIRLHGTD